MSRVALPLPRLMSLGRRNAASTITCGLDFGDPGGPVLAVCGLAGGVGTSTLAYLVARQAARESAAPVVLCEAESGAGGLATLVGASSDSSLGDVAAEVADADAVVDDVHATLSDGLRLIAGAPRRPLNVMSATRRSALSRVLSGLRDRHGLVIVDCGTLTNFDTRATLEAATHVAWVVSAGTATVERAAMLLDSELAPAAWPGTELIAAVATRPPHVGMRGTREVRRLAQGRGRRLMRVPHVPALADGRLDGAEAEIVVSLTMLAGFLRSGSAA